MKRALCFLPLLCVALVAAAGANDLAGKWDGAAEKDGHRWTLRIAAWDTASSPRVCFDFPDYGLYYRCTSDIVLDGSAVHLRYKSGSDVVTFDGTIDGGRYRGTWKGLGVEATFALDRTGPAPEPLIEEDVQFRNGGVTLAGTLIRPAWSRRYAAVVWTHGSGLQQRTEDFYRDRAYLLAENGIASLIYDKRGVGASSGDPDSTLDELAGDAVAAVQMLQQRDDIDRTAVGIGGFSQGGYVAPLAASRYGRIAFVVVGAAPGVTPADQNDYAARTALVRRGLAGPELDEAMALRQDVLVAQKTGEHIADVNARLTAARTRPWFRAADLPAAVQVYGPRGLSVLEFDPSVIWTRLDVPVLAVWGEQDALVPAERSRTLIAGWLNRGGDRDVTLRLFPGAGHGLALNQPSGEWDWPRLAPGFHELLLQWVVEHADRARRSTR